MAKKNKSQRFVDSLSKKLINLGAVEVQATTDSFKSLQIDTIVGKLSIDIDKDSTHCYTMFARFDNVEEAKKKFDCNPHSGKYNTHVGNIPDMTPEKASEICLIAIEITQ